MTPREVRDMLAALHWQPARVIERAAVCAETLVREGRGTWTWARAAYAAAASALRRVGAPLPIGPESEEPWRTLARELLDGGWGLWVGEQVFCSQLLLAAEAGQWDLTILRGIAERHGAISAETPL